MKENRKAASDSGKSKNQQSKYNKIIPIKEDVIFRHITAGNSLHRFQAERLGDHCLPTTISDIQAKHGVYFSRQRVKVGNRFGGETSVSEYWLEGKELAKSRQILNILEAA